MNTASEFEKINVAVGNSATLLYRLSPGGHARTVSVEVVNVSGDVLTDFTIKLINHHNGAEFVFLSDGDFTGGANVNLLFCTTIPPYSINFIAGTSSQFIIQVGAACQVVFYATSNTTSVISIRGTEQQG